MLRSVARVSLLLALGTGGCTFGALSGDGDGRGSEDTSASDGTDVASTVADATSMPDEGDSGSDEGPSSTSTSTSASTTGADADSTSAGPSTGSGDTESRPPEFGEPLRIDVLSDAAAVDDDPALRFDELEIYFNSDRTGDSQIFVSTRATIDDDWEPPVEASILSAPAFGDSTPELSLDGLHITVASDRLVGTTFDIWIANRPNLDAAWSTPVRYSELSSMGHDFGATPVSNTQLYLCSQRLDGLGSLDIWRVDAFDLDALTAGQAVNDSIFNSEHDECTVTTSADQLEIFWERRDVPGGLWELWTATRPDDGTDWQDLAPVQALVAEGDNGDPWLSPDGHRLYFSSSREGMSDLFVVER